MKLFLLPALLLLSCFCYAQEQHSVKEGSPKKDEVFAKNLVTILSDAGNNFNTLKKEFKMKDIVDSIWIIDLKLPGAMEARQNNSKESVTLNEHFDFSNGKGGLNQLLEKIKASLPADFVYTLEYDAESKISNYTFMQKEGSAQKYPGYPQSFYLNGDALSADVTILIFR